MSESLDQENKLVIAEKTESQEDKVRVVFTINRSRMSVDYESSFSLRGSLFVYKIRYGAQMSKRLFAIRFL